MRSVADPGPSNVVAPVGSRFFLRTLLFGGKYARGRKHPALRTDDRETIPQAFFFEWLRRLSLSQIVAKYR
jgi:hypothetical protein